MELLHFGWGMAEWTKVEFWRASRGAFYRDLKRKKLIFSIILEGQSLRTFLEGFCYPMYFVFDFVYFVFDNDHFVFQCPGWIIYVCFRVIGASWSCVVQNVKLFTLCVRKYIILQLILDFEARMFMYECVIFAV